MKDEELDRLRTSLLHAYDKPKTFSEKLATAMKNRIGAAKKIPAKKKSQEAA